MSSNVKLSVGALVVSAWASFLSFGIVAATVFHYFLRFGNDKPLYKTIVLTCLFLCLGDTIISAMWCYRWSSTYYGNSVALLATPREAIAMLLLFSTTTLTVQLWFVNRMWVISMRKNSAFAGVTALLAVASWGIAVWMFSVLVKHHSSLLDDFHRVFPVGYAWLAGGIVTDLCIFGGLAYYTELRSRRDREHHILSPGSLLAISHRMIECNVLPLFSQICMIILFKLNVGLYYTLSVMTITKIYTFSLLVSLNTRAPILEGVSSSYQQRSDAITFTRSRIHPNAVQVRQDVHVTCDSDPSPSSPWQTNGKSEDSEFDKAVLVD